MVLRSYILMSCRICMASFFAFTRIKWLCLCFRGFWLSRCAPWLLALAPEPRGLTGVTSPTERRWRPTTRWGNFGLWPVSRRTFSLFVCRSDRSCSCPCVHLQCSGSPSLSIYWSASVRLSQSTCVCECFVFFPQTRFFFSICFNVDRLNFELLFILLYYFCKTHSSAVVPCRFLWRIICNINLDFSQSVLFAFMIKQ